MYYDYYKSTPCEYDEFICKGICTESPSMSSLQETILIYLKEMAYYLLKLKELGATNAIIRENIIEAISGILTHVDYNHEKFQHLVLTLAQDLSQAKALYANLGQKNKLKLDFLKTHFKQGNSFDIAEIIKKGERYYIKRNTFYTIEQKNLFDVVFLLIKNICIKIIQIRSYKKDYENTYNAILILLNAMNFENTTINEVKSIIETCTSEYYNIVKELAAAQEEAYGQRQSVLISFAPRNGKAILVSGIDLTQLEAVLEATKDKGIDVYTHGITMLMAHTFSKFRKYHHLAGHFGKCTDTSLFDFAAFPGAILMTRYLFQRVEYLYKGRIFTTDPFAPSGIIKIQDNDFEPLIHATLKSKGFTKWQQKVIQRVGFRQKEMEEKIKEISDKMDKNEIKHLYIIGLFHHEDEHLEYFNKFLSLMPKDCYALSLSHEQNEENILHIDSFYDYLLIYKILEKFNEIKPLEQLKITIFITKCDQYTITNIINFINMGIKSIYLCKCIPELVNPIMFETMRKTFGIKGFSTPEQNLEETLSE